MAGLASPEHSVRAPPACNNCQTLSKSCRAMTSAVSHTGCAGAAALLSTPVHDTQICTQTESVLQGQAGCILCCRDGVLHLQHYHACLLGGAPKRLFSNAAASCCISGFDCMVANGRVSRPSQVCICHYHIVRLRLHTVAVLFCISLSPHYAMSIRFLLVTAWDFPLNLTHSDTVCQARSCRISYHAST